MSDEEIVIENTVTSPSKNAEAWNVKFLKVTNQKNKDKKGEFVIRIFFQQLILKNNY